MATGNPKLVALGAADRERLEAQLVKFDQGWCDGRLGEMAGQLPDDSARFPALIELVKIDLERQWQQGRRRIVEDYLGSYPELGDAATVPADLLLAEYQVRRQYESPATLDDFARRFPLRAEELLQLVQHDTATGPGPSASSPTSVGPSPVSATPRPGPVSMPEQFGRYRIIQPLGRGGMGSVYLAHDPQLDRKVALKVPHFSPTDGGSVLQRFFREARAAAAIEHPNICPVYEVGDLNGTHYVAMAYLEGRPLADQIKSGKPLPQRPVAAVVRKLALALQEAHSRGVVHRDLKPSNVMINQRREPVIMDFGLARRIDQGNERLTKDGSILGTPAYMAPEQVNGDLDAMGPSCDIYSLGVILYELLTTELPFQGSMAAILGQILTQEPVPPSKLRADLDPALEAICMKAMAKQPADRYATMAELAAALTQYLKSESQATPLAPTLPFGIAPRPVSLTALPQDSSTSGASHSGTIAGRPRKDSLVTELLPVQPDRPSTAPGLAGDARQRGSSRWLWAAFVVVPMLLILLACGTVGGLFVVLGKRSPEEKTTQFGSKQPPEEKTTLVVQLNVVQKENDAPVAFILNGRRMTREELAQPVQLQAGENTLEVQYPDGSIETIRFHVSQEHQAKRIDLPPGERTPPKSKQFTELVLYSITWDIRALEQSFEVGERKYNSDKREITWLLTAKRDTDAGAPEADYWGAFFDADNVEVGKLQVQFTPRGRVKQGNRVVAALPHRSFGSDFLQRAKKVVLVARDGSPPDPELITWDTSAFMKDFTVGTRSHDIDKKQFSWILVAKQDCYVGSPEADYWGAFIDAEGVRIGKLQVLFEPRGKVKKGDKVRAILPHQSFDGDLSKRAKKVVILPPEK